jgi:hypothetical protein
MDSFRLIQNFFTRMSCHHCNNHFAADDIELIREEHGIHVVSVSCHHCQRQVGVAMVGVDAHGAAATHDTDDEDSMQHNLLARYVDPELTPEELARLSAYDPITADDVLEAHHFFTSLDAHWMQYLPPSLVDPVTGAADVVLDMDDSRVSDWEPSTDLPPEIMPQTEAPGL